MAKRKSLKYEASNYYHTTSTKASMKYRRQNFDWKWDPTNGQSKQKTKYENRNYTVVSKIILYIIHKNNSFS